MKSILKVEGLTKWFGNINAIDNISFEVKAGQVVGLLGPNGSGKTTTLSIILGVKHASAGTFSWLNHEKGALVNTKIGSLIEVPYFYPYLNLEKNLQIVAQVKGVGYHEIGIVLEKVGLNSRSKSKFYTLSLGMKQRLALASALLGNPEVLVLDEPTNGLDPEGIAEVREIILEQSHHGKTIILASHILDEVEKVCSHAIILKKGKIISMGEVKELLTDKQMISIGYDDIDLLVTGLQSLKGIKIIERKEDRILISLDEGITTSSVNMQLVNLGIVPNLLEVHKKTLESQFLELVKH